MKTAIHSTGIDQIIAEAGVARRTLYNQFGSKEGLIRAVMQRESNAWFEWLRFRAGAFPTYVIPGQRIIRFFALLGKWFSRSDFQGLLLHQCGRRTPARQLRTPDREKLIVKPTSSIFAASGREQNIES